MGKKRNTNKVTLAVPLSVAAIGGGKGFFLKSLENLKKNFLKVVDRLEVLIRVIRVIWNLFILRRWLERVLIQVFA